MSPYDPFEEFGAAFSLYRAPVSTCSECAAGHCDLCGRDAPISFRLEVGADVLVRCDACDGITAFDPQKPPSSLGCSSCARPLVLPALSKYPRCCDACLRDGRAALTKDTELGMVRWVDAVRGVTHGRPDLPVGETVAGFEILPPADGSKWPRARVPTEVLLQLTRTPNYASMNGDCWLFCCSNAMAYLGFWGAEDFETHAAGGDAEALFVRAVGPDHADAWEFMDDAEFHAFECTKCARLRAVPD